MLLTVNLSLSETRAYRTMRTDICNWAKSHARFHGRRFAQIVGTDGSILDVIEVSL